MRKQAQMFLPRLIVAISAASLLATVALYASGTYRAPRPPIVSTQSASSSAVEQGRRLFEGMSLVGSGGKPCGACHDAVVPLRRSSLLKKGPELAALINREVTHPDRTAAPRPLPRDSQELTSLGAYILARYRLPRDYMQYLTGK